MLEFFLHTTLFEYVLAILIFINFIAYLVSNNKKNKNELFYNKSNENNKFKKRIIATVTIVFLLVIILYLLIIKKIILFNFFIYLLYPIISLTKYIYKIMNNKKCKLNITFEEKMISNYVFLVLFNSKTYEIYLKSFTSLKNHLEWFLIIFLIFRIVFFVFSFVNNVLILLTFIKKYFEKHKIRYKKEYKFFKYDFNPENEKNCYVKSLKYILYTILIVPEALLNIIVLLLLKMWKCFIKFIKKVPSNPYAYLKKVIQISFIIALVIVYINMTYYKKIFTTDYICEIYNFISTALLIPLIYDSIPKNKKN